MDERQPANENTSPKRIQQYNTINTDDPIVTRSKARTNASIITPIVDERQPTDENTSPNHTQSDTDDSTPLNHTEITGSTFTTEIRSSPTSPTSDIIISKSPAKLPAKSPAKSSSASRSCTPASFNFNINRNKSTSRVTTPIDDDGFDSDAYDDDELEITINSQKEVAKEQQYNINEPQNESDGMMETLGEVVEMKVNRLVRGVVNLLIKDKELWGQLKDIVESAPTPIKNNPLNNSVANSQQVNFSNIIIYHE